MPNPWDVIKNRLPELLSRPQPEAPQEIPDLRPPFVSPIMRPERQQPTAMDLQLSPMSSQPQQQQSSGPDPYEEMFNRNYTPAHAGIDQMNEMIKNYPKRENPSLMRKIFGGMAAAVSGPTGYEYVTQGPNRQRMADWEAQFAPVKELANQERYENANERQAAASVVSTRRLADSADATAANRTETLRQTAARTALEAWKALNPNLNPIQDRASGRLFVRKPDGKVEYILTPDGQPIMGMDVSPEQKQKYALELAGVNNAADIGMNNADNAQSAANTAANNAQSNTNNLRTTAASIEAARIRAKAAAGQQLSPQEQKVLNYSRAEELANSKPEYANWFILDPLQANEVAIKSPETMVKEKGMDLKVAASMYSDIVELMYGPERANLIRRNYGIQKALGPVGTPTGVPGVQGAPVQPAIPNQAAPAQGALPLTTSIPLAQRVKGQTRAMTPQGIAVLWNGASWDPVQ